MKIQQEKVNFTESVLDYYKFLQNRFNNACEYIDKMVEKYTVDEVENSKEYRAFKDIMKELSEIEVMINKYSVLNSIKGRIK